MSAVPIDDTRPFVAWRPLALGFLPLAMLAWWCPSVS